MGLFENFPYANFHELNLDWILHKLKELETEITNFVAINSVKYANPITWDITRQYETNTVVLDSSGNAYLSVQPVPAGVALDREEYWTKIGNFSALWDSVRSAITPYDEQHSTTASVDHNVGDWVWLENDLVLITKSITAGDKYVEGSNCQNINIMTLFNNLQNQITGEATARQNADNQLNEKISAEASSRETADNELSKKISTVVGNLPYKSVKEFGAVGDNVADDTEAFKQAIAQADVIYVPKGNYKISETLTIPTNKKIIGQGKEFSWLYFSNGNGIEVSGRLVTLANITLWGNGGYGVKFTADAYGYILQDVIFNDFAYGISNTVQIWNSSFIRCRFNRSTTAAINILTPPAGSNFCLLFEECTFIDNKVDLIANALFGQFNSCNFGFSYSWGVQIGGASNIQFNSCNFECDDFIGGSDALIQISSDKADFNNCIFSCKTSPTTGIFACYNDSTGGVTVNNCRYYKAGDNDPVVFLSGPFGGTKYANIKFQNWEGPDPRSGIAENRIPHIVTNSVVLCYNSITLEKCFPGLTMYNPLTKSLGFYNGTEIKNITTA